VFNSDRGTDWKFTRTYLKTVFQLEESISYRLHLSSIKICTATSFQASNSQKYQVDEESQIPSTSTNFGHKSITSFGVKTFNGYN